MIQVLGKQFILYSQVSSSCEDENLVICFKLHAY